MKSEERRALVLLGITAVLASFLATMYALIWTGMKKQEDFFFNVPCTAVPHLTVYDVPILQTLISAWIAYAVFAFFYFSDDWFQSKRGIRFRNACHVFAAFSMGFYFIFAVFFIPSLYVLLVWIPPEFGATYVAVVLLGLLYIEVRFVEMALYSRGLYGRLLKQFWRLTYGPIFTAFEIQLMNQMTRLWDKHGSKLPRQLRDELGSLKRSIKAIRRNRRVRGRVKLFTFFLGLIAVSLVVGFSLYRFYCG